MELWGEASCCHAPCPTARHNGHCVTGKYQKPSLRKWAWPTPGLLGQHLFAKSGLPWPRDWVRGWVRRNVLGGLVQLCQDIWTLSSSPAQGKTGRRCTSNDTVREPARRGRDGKSRVCRTSVCSLQRIVSLLSPARPAGHDGSSCSLSGQRPVHACCVAAIRWTATDSPAAPAPVSHPILPHANTRAHTHDAAVPCQATNGQIRANHSACVGVQTALRRPAACPGPTTLTHVPLSSSAGDPASGSPLSSLTLLLARELERGTVGATMAYARLQQQWSPPECALCLISTYHTPGIVPTALYLMLRSPTRLPGRLSGPGSAARLRVPGGHGAIESDDEAQGLGMHPAP